MIFHLMSFEGPDAYSRAGGVASRVTGLAHALARRGETHLWFVGDPKLPGEETVGELHLHRWCQWLSEHHPAGVYAGEGPKVNDYSSSLPHAVLAHIRESSESLVMAEDWHTAPALLHLQWLLRRAELRTKARLWWNVNNTTAFGKVDFPQLTDAALVTTVSRYMRGLARQQGVEAIVIPNGIDDDAQAEPEPSAVARLREAAAGRALLVKIARWVREKRWILALDTLGVMKAYGHRPVLVARGGIEAHGAEVTAHARRAGLTVVDTDVADDALEQLAKALEENEDADVILLTGPIEGAARRALYRAADAVLAHSSHEPFGMVGLETMAAGGVVCTGATGEDYAVPGLNSLVVQSDDPNEFLQLYAWLKADPAREARLRAEARATARRYSWDDVIEGALLPRLVGPAAAKARS